MKLLYRLLIISGLLIFHHAMYAQQITVSGNVVDENGEPLTGVTIQVKGTSAGTVTDISGDFTIHAPQNSTLQFSFNGFATLEKVATTSPMRVIMH